MLLAYLLYLAVSRLLNFRSVSAGGRAEAHVA